MKLLCKETVLAINSGEKLFIKGNEYSASVLGYKNGEGTQTKDETGCLQTIYDAKFLKKHFKVIE
jgi:hypothetical protein